MIHPERAQVIDLICVHVAAMAIRNVKLQCKTLRAELQSLTNDQLSRMLESVSCENSC